MSILNFVRQEDLDELDEDPRNAFMQLVNHAQRSLNERTKGLDEQDQYQWRDIEDERHSFMNVILASAKRFEIEPFATMAVPRQNDFRSEDWRQFKSDLDHYITQLVLDNSTRSRADTVAILPKSKDAIRTYVRALRDCIENASMEDKKREALLKKLDALEVELEKRRTSMLSVARIAYHLWAVPGSMWASYEVANKLIANVMHTVAEAKDEEERNKPLPAPEPMKALSPPRSLEVASKQFGGGFRDDLDDDVPF